MGYAFAEKTNEMADAIEAPGKDLITQAFSLAPYYYFDYTTISSLDSGERSALNLWQDDFVAFCFSSISLQILASRLACPSLC